MSESNNYRKYLDLKYEKCKVEYKLKTVSRGFDRDSLTRKEHNKLVWYENELIDILDKITYEIKFYRKYGYHYRS